MWWTGSIKTRKLQQLEVEWSRTSDAQIYGSTSRLVDLWPWSSSIYTYCEISTARSSKGPYNLSRRSYFTDLLNLASSSKEEITFILDDPYGFNEMVDEDDSDDDGDGHMPHVTHGTDLALLGIEEYMDLSKTKLHARFDESITHPALSTPLVPTLSTPAAVEATSTFANKAWATTFMW